MRPLAPGALGELARRPGLWPTAVRVGLRLAAPGWWRRWPPLPWPDEGYLLFRMETMYGPGGAAGDGGGTLSGPDLVGYLEWCRRRPRRAR